MRGRPRRGFGLSLGLPAGALAVALTCHSAAALQLPLERLAGGGYVGPGSRKLVRHIFPASKRNGPLRGLHGRQPQHREAALMRWHTAGAD
jgi:hypothetical protein